MEINDLRVEKFNKINNLGNLSSPELLSSLCIVDKINYAKDISCFKGKTSNIQCGTKMDRAINCTSPAYNPNRF